MSLNHPFVVALVCFAGSACSGSPKKAQPKTEPSDPEAVYGALDIGDYMSWNKLSTAPFRSPTHGNRFVEVYVNDIAKAAYLGEDDFPVGSILVKTSFAAEGDQPSDQLGPVFIMRKEAAGYAPDTEDWWYGFHWEDPQGVWKKRLGGPVYWRGKSSKVGYCVKCHDNYDRGVGGIPDGSLVSP